MKKNLKLLVMMGLPFLFASCVNTEDLYDPAKADELLKAEYSANFIAKYGEIAPDQSWDATVTYSKYNTSASTRADGSSYFTKGDYYEIEKNTIDWLKKNLPESGKNSGKGSPFEMMVPANPFTIVPIYQVGHDKWSLWIKVGNDTAYKIWTKSEDFEYYSRNGEWYSVNDETDGSTAYFTTLRAKKLEFNYSSRAGEPMWLYLQIEEANSGVSQKDDKLWSDEGQMIALDMGEGKPNIEGEVRMIGCEDSYLGNCDTDMNDVVFLMYGNPKIPDVIPIPKDRKTTITTKRYMIEDLGSTVDFDFNDIVVDVEQTVVEELISDGTAPNWKEVSKTQTATIRHLGGVLPFTLKIGNTDLGKMEGQMNADPNTERTITGWEPTENNISVKVGDLKNDGTHEFTFPENGEVPMIIAVDPSVEWMKERVSITSDWFDSLKK